MDKILISACLLGEPVRYDGVSMPLDHPLIHEWKREGRLIPVCPETAGGLPVPRPPAEISGGGGSRVLEGDGRVLTRTMDVTGKFVAGALAVLDLVRKENICHALLKERSPSCGSTFIYDGSFSGIRIPGMGVTTALLRRHGVIVFSENGIDTLGKCIKQ